MILSYLPGITFREAQCPGVWKWSFALVTPDPGPEHLGGGAGGVPSVTSKSHSPGRWEPVLILYPPPLDSKFAVLI